MKINEIFYSLQGEGAHTGTPAVFVRFSGCNLRCPFCDTEHQKGAEMSARQIVDEVTKYPAEWVILTGGEPTLQNNDILLDLLHQSGKKVAIETNGTRQILLDYDWITISPKQMFLAQPPKSRPQNGVINQHSANEIKLVFDDLHGVDDYNIKAEHYYLQPCDVGNKEKNAVIVQHCIEYIKSHPKWKLSLQTQKILNVR